MAAFTGRDRHHIRKSKEVRAPKGNGSDLAVQSCIEPMTHSERLLPSPPPDKSSVAPQVSNGAAETDSAVSEPETHSRPAKSALMQESLRRSHRLAKPNPKYKDYVVYK